MKFYKVSLEVPITFGEGTIYNRTSGKLIVSNLSLKWLMLPKGEIMECSPIFCITDNLYNELKKSDLKGIKSYEKVECGKSEMFDEIYSHPTSYPEFLYRIHIDGEAGREDFGIDKGYLILSEKSFKTIFKSNKNRFGKTEGYKMLS